MKFCILVFIFILAGCQQPETAVQRGDAGQNVVSGFVVKDYYETNRAGIVQGDEFRFYIGENISEKLQAGVEFETDYLYMMLQMPKAMVQQVALRDRKIQTFSMEDKRNLSSITIRGIATDAGSVPGHVELETKTFQSGEPWFSGYAQVVISDSGIPRGLFDVTKYYPSPNGAISRETHTTGLLPDPESPKLMYNGRPETWPVLPEDWTSPPTE